MHLPDSGARYTGIFEEAVVAKRYNRSLVEFYALAVEEREVMIAVVRSEEKLKAVMEERAMAEAKKRK
jgi:hypothetical protein